MPKQRRQSEANRKLNLYISRLIPGLLVGAIGYSAWVVTKLLCIDYLLHSQRIGNITRRRNTGAAAAILVVYYVLMTFTLVCYARLLDAVIRRPGVVPRGAQWTVEQRRKGTVVGEDGVGEKNGRSEKERSHTQGCDEELCVEDFWLRDVFTCKFDGRPDFCSTCYNWKPDRSHHCKELNRCVLKMDHFCPWVGGVVGEASFKFFVQFTFWAALFCFHVLVSMAYFLAQRKRDGGAVDANWAVTLGLAALFFSFSACMCLSSGQFACINSTTIENIGRKSKVWYLAIYIPDHLIPAVLKCATEEVRLITYPRPANEQLQLLEQEQRETKSSNSGDTTEHGPEAVDQPAGPLRTFGIFPTQAGEIPWDDGLLSNFMAVMGYDVWDWLLPIRRSPCTNHSSTESFYKVGKVVERIRGDAGIVDQPTDVKEASHKQGERRRRRRRRRRSSRRHSTPIV